MEETIIISLGGSMIVPEKIDIQFLKDFRTLILEEVKKGRKFVLVCGGGETNRTYNAAAQELINPSTEDLDWIGIATIMLNAELIRVIFGEHAHPKAIADLTKPLAVENPVIIGGALEPGHSSDLDAVLAAKNLKAKKIINLSNIDHVYDSDPRKNPNAKKFEKISWAEYRKLIPEEWSSKLSTPFDPIASKDAEEAGIEVVIMNGKPIDNLANYLNGEKFLGTVIY
ncbi:MAG TPA: UMP kinase [Candidatus Paceibacterota bacterium]|jgi:uridylate kinase|nr:UMP kinase [Candidatus Paceibacterota bacterium]